MIFQVKIEVGKTIRILEAKCHKFWNQLSPHSSEEGDTSSNQFLMLLFPVGIMNYIKINAQELGLCLGSSRYKLLGIIVMPGFSFFLRE